MPFVHLDIPAPRSLTYLSDYRFDRTYFVHDYETRHRLWRAPSGANILPAPDGALLCTVYYSSPREVAFEGSRSAAPDRPDRALQAFQPGYPASLDRPWPQLERLRYTVAALPPSGERAAWVGDEGYNEASLAWLPDGRLYAVYRTAGRSGQIGKSWSSDGGKTWTAPASTGVPGVAPRIHRMSNGALVYGDRPSRAGDSHSFNLDGQGRKWSHPVTIYTDMSTRYCDLLEVSPGAASSSSTTLVPYGWYERSLAARRERAQPDPRHLRRRSRRARSPPSP